MDELLQHCLQELAFDGDLGCDVSRLRDFVGEFYTSHNSMPQNLDDSYHAFVWSLVAQQPSVRVGLLPDGQTSEVYVPPQPRGSRKGKSAQDDGNTGIPTAATLEPILNANNRLLGELIQTYGNRLRIAVDSETCFVATTGSHAKPAKLTPMVYASLQLISRSRESGLSVLELGKATGYDQKTCFYLVKQLLDLDLVVKLRRGGNSQNFCVHKYFFDRSPTWKKIREEEYHTYDDAIMGGRRENDSADAGTGSLQLPQFDPIDTRHLTSLNILRQRLTKLLKHSLNETQPYPNISVRIGFRPRSRTDRRFFIVRLKELINEGTIEKFFVTSSNPDTTQNKQLYLRLASNRDGGPIPSEGSVKVTDDDEDMINNLVTEDTVERSRVTSTVTLHKQIIDLVQESSTTGATLNELCDRLGSFDRRTLELIISRMERQAPPLHLADLSVIQVLETHGRERRYRFFTLSGYSELITREGFEQQPSHQYSSEDLTKAGGFMEYRETDFYETRDDLQMFLKRWSGVRIHKFRASTDRSGKTSRRPNNAITEGNDGQPKSSPPKKKWTNPILPDGTRKRGRPLKNPNASEKRGQKRTRKNAEINADASLVEAGGQTNPVENVATTFGMREGIKRKRNEAEHEESEAEGAGAEDGASLKGMSKIDVPQDAPRRKRERPPKKKKTTGVIDPDPSVERDANAESFRGEATADASKSRSAQPKKSSPRRKKQGSDLLSLPIPDPTSVSPSLFPPVQPSNRQESSPILDLTRSGAAILQSQASPMSSNPHDATQVPDTLAAQCFTDASEVSPATLSASDDNRLGDHSSLQVSLPEGSSIPVRANDDPQLHTATLLEPLAAFQGGSHEIMGQSENNDKITRVIASLAAQVNESLSSSLYANSTERNVVMQLPVISPTQSVANDIVPSVHPSSLRPDTTNSAAGSTMQRGESPRGFVDAGAAAVMFNTRDTVEGGMLIDVRSEAMAQCSSVAPAARGPDIVLGDVSSPATASIAKSKKGVSGRYEHKTNLTAMRRENELVQLVENAGGILNTSTTEFLTAYMNFIEAAVKAGEAASAPIGARIDRRTLNYSLDKLETTGRIRTIITNLPSVTGGYRNSKFAYLPTVSEERVRHYISAQGSNGVAVPRRQEQVREHVEKEIELDPSSPHGLAEQWLYSNNSQEVYQERWHRNAHRAEQLFSHSDDVVREAILLERQTLSQLYGYITGKVMRVRELHLRTIEHLERRGDSPFIVSPEQRIVSWAFFENDISLATHCACVTSPIFREDISNALATNEGRNKPVKDIPQEWKQALQIGKARSRERIFDLLDYLHSMQLVTPLRESKPDNSPGPRDAEGRIKPTAFEAMPSDWVSKVPLVRPEYWQFSAIAPVYLFALRMDPAPFCKIVPTLSEVDVLAYWTELKDLCLNRNHAENAQRDSTPGPYTGELRVATALRRSASWTADYTLSWYQTQYLKRFVDIYNGATPLQDQDPEMSRMRRISHVLSAPLDVVRNYFESSREVMLRELEKKQRRKARKSSEKQEADMKLLLVQKGLEAVRNRESAWDSMVEKVHPGLVKGVAAARLRKLRQSFVRGNVVQDNHHWELQISGAIKAAEKMRSSRNLFPSFSQVTREVSIRKQPEIDPSQLPSAPQGKSVESLIDMQKIFSFENGEIEVSGVGARKSKKKAKARKVKNSGRVRRQRFQWNADYDELVRDAYAILRARCRTHYRLEWGALDRIFPSVPRNSIRARMAMLKDQSGAEAYLQRLENCWHDLWVKRRGTPELPDQNPRNPVEFDLKTHLEYLRKHVDKNAIRVGVATLEEVEYNALPADLEDFVSSSNLEERKPVHANWDFLSNAITGEEAREKLFLEAAFVMESDYIPAEDAHSDFMFLAESALKMVVGTPNEFYNANLAASVLHGIGENEIGTAMDNLLSRSVFSKLVRDPTRLVPGRTVKISEMNQNALGGPIAKDLFLDASQLEESYGVAKDEWREWPPTSTDGDTAALLQQFSDHNVEFDVDTSHARAARPTIDGNSRKVDDDDIELSVQVKLSGISVLEKQASPTGDEPDLIEVDDTSSHGTSILGEQACCKMRSEGIVDCLRCIEEAQLQLADWSDGDKRVVNSIVQYVDGREKHGTRIEELRQAFKDTTEDLLTSIIHRLHTLRVPPIYVTGYVSTIVVSAKYASAWTVILPGENVPLSRVFPRRWLDITAGRVTIVWEAALRAVVGLVHLRPGISQAELRWRLRSVYDRQEVIDLVNHLMSNGTLKSFRDGAWQPENTVCIEALSEEEEKAIFWAVREEKRWYQSF